MAATISRAVLITGCSSGIGRATFDIDAILIEPGLIRTHFGETAVATVGSRPTADDPYRAFNEAVVKATRETYERGLLARLGGGPEAVAHTIERAITSPRPKTRYLVTPSASLLVMLRRVLPDRLWDRVLHMQYPQPQ